MADLPAETRRAGADRSAAASSSDLDARIRLAELSVIERDERVRGSVDAVKDRIRRKGGLALALTGVTGGSVLLLARLWSLRHKQKPLTAAGARPPAASRWLRILGFAVPILRVAAHRASGGAVPGNLIGLGLPMLAQFLAGRQHPPRSELVLPPVSSAAQIDLQRYLGRWHEVARLPTPYEKHCAGDVMASYTRVGPRLLSVLNSCRRSNGRMTSVRGVARVVNGSGNARLRISFAPWLLRGLPLAWGDYWVLMVDSEYRYALAGTPDRRRLWLLSRTPALNDADQQRLLDHARAQGYDTAALISTPRLGSDEYR